MKLPAFVLALPIVILSAAVMAEAECLTKDDLAGLTSVVYEGDQVENFMPAPAQPFLTMSVEIFPDGFSSVYLLTHGDFLQEKGEYQDDAVVSGSTIPYDYGIEDTGLPVPVPVPGGGWQTDVTVIDGGGDYDEPQTVTWGKARTVSIGSCSYQAFDVTIAYATDDNYLERLTYIAALGLGYLVYREAEGTEPETISATAIRVAK